MICVRALALTCLAAHAVEIGELTESVSLLQTGVSKKKQGPNLVPLVMGPPWVDVDPDAFNALKSEGKAMLNIEALELDLTDKEPEGSLPEGMRFSKVGRLEGNDVDLVIKIDETEEKYDSGRIKEAKGEFNGLHKGVFARVYSKAGATQKMKLSVVKTKTDEILKVPLLAVTFFSLGGFGKGGKKFPTSVSDCNTDLVSEFWAAPNIQNETKGGCGGVTFKGTGQLKGKGKSEPPGLIDLNDEYCWDSLLLKWFDAEEVTLDLTAGGPVSKKGLSFMFKVGVTQCDVTWEPPPTKAELKAMKQAEKAAAKAAKDFMKAEGDKLKAEAKAAKAAAKAAKR